MKKLNNGSGNGTTGSASGPNENAVEAWQAPGLPRDPYEVSSEVSLSAGEQAQLTELENRIVTGLRIFFYVGAALTEIRNKRLYRNGYATFEAYCRERWDFTRSYANRLISASEVTAHLVPIGAKVVCESQVRPLIGLAPEQISVAWTKALAMAGNGKLTAKHTQSAVTELKGGPVPPPKAKVAKQPRQSRAALKPALKLIDQAEKAAKAKDTDAVLEVLARLRDCLTGTIGNSQ